MDEYISREEVMSIITNMQTEYLKDFANLEDRYVVAHLLEVADKIKDLKAADVQSVKRGRWIIVDDVEHFIAVCSECERTEDSRGIKDMPYCHCGARMDGDSK